MRRIVAALVALVLPVAVLVPAPSASAYEAPARSPFSDVSTSHVFYQQMSWLSARGISTGYADGTFRPGQPVLREQMAAFLYRLEGSPELPAPARSPFTDVSRSHAFFTQMAWLSVRGIATGYANGDGTDRFEPSATVLREQMAAFLYRLEDVDAPAEPVPFDTSPAPTVTGAAQVGQTLTAVPGSWSPAAAFSYQWSADGTAIAGATDRTVVVAAAHQGKRLTVAVTGSIRGRIPTTRVSSSTAAVAPGTFATVRPVVTGQPDVGAVLTVSVPAWTPAATGLTVQWWRDGAPISGQTASTYQVVAADRGTSISARVTGTRAGYTAATVLSDPVRVGAIPAVVDVAGTIAVDTVWGPDDARVRRVTGDLTIVAGATLTLLPGTVVKVQSGRSLRVEGTLHAAGTASAQVVVTSVRDDRVVGDTNGDGTATSPAPRDWAGISVRSRGAVLMENARVGYADTAIDADGTFTAAPTVALSATTVSQSVRCIDASGPVTGSFTGTVRECGTGVSADHAFDARNVDWGSASGPSPYGDGVAFQGETIAVLPWTGYVAPARPLVASPQPAPAVTSCGDVVLVGVRGSAEHPESPTPTTPAQYASDEVGFGAYNYAIAVRMDEQIRATRPGTSVKFLAVQYLALQIPNYDPDVSYLGYVASIYDGVDKLTQLLAAEGSRCPDSRFVLMGTSQGALVVQAALDAMDDPRDQARVGGVVLLANPARVPGSTETLWESDGVPARPEVRDVAGAWIGFLPGLDRPVPAWAAPRTISMCHLGDVFCAFAPGAGVYPHVTYTTEDLHSLAVWQGTRVAQALPPAS